jgi:acyl-CoA thioesterase-2
LTDNARAAYSGTMSEHPTPAQVTEQLVDLLRVDDIGGDVFIGAQTQAGLKSKAGRLFGGQVIAQALAAAQGTVPGERLAHSLHAYFLRMGDDAQPVRYEVSRDFDGGSFNNRRVIARQGDRLLLNLIASFHREEQGLSHQETMPDVPGPDGLPSDYERRLARGLTQRPLERRPVEDYDPFNPKTMPPRVHTWVRALAPIGDDPCLHRAMLAYASDLLLLPTASRPHGLSYLRGELREASLDHAIWFHDSFRADEWLLFATHGTWADHGRALISGRVYRQDGKLVASLTQEGMIRVVEAD